MTRARDLAAFVSNADGDIKFDTDTLFIDSSANRVGIGDTTPQALLDVGGGYGSNTTVATFADATDAYIEIENMTSQNGAGVIFTNAGTKKWTLQKDGAAHGLYFQDASSNANLTLLQGGNVGIGTSSPSSDLHIATTTGGTISLEDTDNGFSASTINVENGGRDLAIFAPQDIIFDQNGAETARFLDGGGLTFNGDTAAANALDDYEEGTWTPSTNVNGFNKTISSYSDAEYTKIGGIVTARCTINLAASGYANAYGNITGLPYSANYVSATGRFVSGSIGAGGNGGAVYVTGTQIYLFETFGTTTSDAWSTQWYLSFTYRTDS